MFNETGLLSGLRLLIVEDQPLIAMDIEEMLLALSAASVAIANSIKEGRGIVAADDTFDVAVLDYAVGDENSVSLAMDLLRQNVAVVFISGYDSRQDVSLPMPEELREVPFVDKPVAPRVLEEALQVALRRSRPASRGEPTGALESEHVEKVEKHDDRYGETDEPE